MEAEAARAARPVAEVAPVDSKRSAERSAGSTHRPAPAMHYALTHRLISAIRCLASPASRSLIADGHGVTAGPINLVYGALRAVVFFSLHFKER